MKEHKLLLTADGSHSLHSEKFNALYHSSHGAIQESNHVFIQSGLVEKAKSSGELNILEMGFGTGLNLLLTHIFNEDKNLSIHYDTIEAFPIHVDTARTLNYCTSLNRPDLESLFLELHTSKWDIHHQLAKNLSYRKLHTKLEEANLDQKYDLIYYDAFAPLTQEELWTPEIFQHLARFLNPSALLVSYCAKGSFKRALLSAGFSIEKIPGPPGKREMIRGTYAHS